MHRDPMQGIFPAATETASVKVPETAAVKVKDAVTAKVKEWEPVPGTAAQPGAARLLLIPMVFGQRLMQAKITRLWPLNVIRREQPELQ